MEADVEPPSKQKGKRGDRQDPLFYRTVKIPFNGIVRPEIVNEIEKLVLNSNPVIMQAYLLIKAFILYEFKTSKSICFPDEDLCARAMSLIARISRKTSHPDQQKLDLYFRSHFEKLLDPNRLKLDGYCNIFVNASEQMNTGYMNNIVKMYPIYIKRLITFSLNGPIPDFSQLNKVDKKAYASKKKLNKPRIERTYYAIMYKDPTNLDDVERSIYDLCIKEYVPIHTLITPTKNSDEDDKRPSIFYDIVKNYKHYLIYMLKCNKLFEDNDLKLFQPLCLRKSDIPGHINLQATTFINIFSQTYLGFPDKNVRDILNSIKRSDPNGSQNRFTLWNSIINMNHPIFKQQRRAEYEFYNVMYTDAVAVSLVFVKYPEQDIKLKGKALKKYAKTLRESEEPRYLKSYTDEQKEELKGKAYVAVDPGKNSLVTMINEEGKVLRYTQKHRAQTARFNKCRKTRERIRKTTRIEGRTVEEYELALSDLNSKTVNYDKFMTYVVQRLETSRRIQYVYQQKAFRNMKLRSFIYARKSVDTFINRIKSTYGEDIVLAYGDWGGAYCFKGCAPSLGKGLRSKIARCESFTTIMVDEYRTSCRCHECGKAVEMMKVKTKAKKQRKIYAIKICKECRSPKRQDEAISRIMNRDVNGSKNILQAFKTELYEGRRPEHLKRGAVTKSAANAVRGSDALDGTSTTTTTRRTGRLSKRSDNVLHSPVSEVPIHTETERKELGVKKKLRIKVI